MAEEYFFQVALEGEHASEVWNPENTSEDADVNPHYGVDQKLIIKTALLGPEAKEGELNVLAVEAMGINGQIKAPIALLQRGKTEQIALDFSFPDPPVTFSLLRGSGPVHIVGHNLLGTHIEEFDGLEDDMEEENIDEEDDEKDCELDDEEDDEPKRKNFKSAAPENKNKNQTNNKNKRK